MEIKEYLKSIIKEKLEVIRPTIENFPWESDFHYGTWCVQTYKFVYHTVPLLEKTAATAQGPLKDILLHHRDEERGHEKFAKRDAAFLNRDCIKEATMPEALSLYQPIENAGDHIIEALFGYAFALENISATYCGYMAQRVLKRHGKTESKNHLANTPASFLTLHALVDQEHAETGWDCLNHLDSHSYEGVANSMRRSFVGYESFLKAVASQVQPGVIQDAANF